MYVAENVLLIYAHVELYSVCVPACSYVTRLDLTVNYGRKELWMLDGDREDEEMRSQVRKKAKFSTYTQMR